MLGCCNSKLFLQSIDSETRKWASQTIGECEMEMRTKADILVDGDEGHQISLGKRREVRPAVFESELRLARHDGYLLLPDGLPVAKIRLTADHVARRGPPRQPRLIEADPATMLWGKAAPASPISPAPPSPAASSPLSTQPESQGPV